MSKTGIGQSLLVCSDCIRDQDILKRGSLAADFEIAVGISSFEFVV